MTAAEILRALLHSPRGLGFISPGLGLVTSSGQQQVADVRAAKPGLALKGQVQTSTLLLRTPPLQREQARRACWEGERLQETEETVTEPSQGHPSQAQLTSQLTSEARPMETRRNFQLSCGLLC